MGSKNAASPSWAWTLIERGHPAARAIYWHVSQELEGYRLLGVRQPLDVRLDSKHYWQAHARACWEEARYWQAWAAAEEQEIPAAAFLRTHPLREPDEIEQVLDHLVATWRLALEQPSVVALMRARDFYREKELTRADVERWLR
ncbi:MAG: hypothetical protein HY690_06485 [Chloroflexi bacterium]|nr:hypothetical protein [Chloroflexota bacterium]